MRIAGRQRRRGRMQLVQLQLVRFVQFIQLVDKPTVPSHHLTPAPAAIPPPPTTSSSPPPPSPSPPTSSTSSGSLFTVMSGTSQCSVTNGGTCVTDGPAAMATVSAADQGQCGGDALCDTPARSCRDRITIGSTTYRGSSGPSGVSMTRVRQCRGTRTARSPGRLHDLRISSTSSSSSSSSVCSHG